MHTSLAFTSHLPGDGFDLLNCTGSSALSPIGLYPFSGWASDDIVYTVDYPIVLREVTGNWTGTPDPLFARVSYSSWSITELYQDSGAGFLTLYTDSFTFSGDGNKHDLLYMPNHGYASSRPTVKTQPMELRYKVLVICTPGSYDPAIHIMHLAPLSMHSRLPFTPNGSGVVIPDELLFQAASGDCALNIASYQTNSNNWGDGVCAIQIPASPYGAGSFAFSPQIIHYFGECPCPGGQFNGSGVFAVQQVSTGGNITKHFGVCSNAGLPSINPFIRVKVKWSL